MNLLKSLILIFIYAPLLVFSQDNDLTVHEWGTFTTLSTPSGELLNGLTRVEEPIPDFVYRLSTSYDRGVKIDLKGKIEVINVNARMETPVIYFYTSEKADYEVNVSFKGGTISEWYPKQTDGEDLSDVNQQGVYEYNDVMIRVDLADGYLGNISWKGEANPNLKYNQLTWPDSLAGAQWIAPRKTNSTFLESHNGQIERYLFYRGIAHLVPPLNVAFNTEHNLVISNTSLEVVPYVFVYENSGNTNRVLWQGHIPGEFAEVVDFDKQLCNNCLEEKKEDFSKALVKAGLYEDESWALLNTWEESYFHTEGIKVFWIMPKSYIEEILPMEITPAPRELERVFVGRSEILTPEKMTTLAKMPFDLFKKSYQEDRFYHCFENARSIKNGELSRILKDTSLKPFKEWELELYPNPAGDQITLVKPDFELKNARVQIVDVNGRVHHSKLLKFDFSYWEINVSDLRPGVYQVVLKSSNEIAGNSFIKK